MHLCHFCNIKYHMNMTRRFCFWMIYSSYRLIIKVCGGVFILLKGVFASWLVNSSQGQVVQFPALAGDPVVEFWPRHLTLTVPLSTHVG